MENEWYDTDRTENVLDYTDHKENERYEAGRTENKLYYTDHKENEWYEADLRENGKVSRAQGDTQTRRHTAIWSNKLFLIFQNKEIRPKIHFSHILISFIGF